MTSSTMSYTRQYTQDPEVWASLKKAIAASSGFRRWQAEKTMGDEPLEPMELDEQVYAYLKQTLDTLAY